MLPRIELTRAELGSFREAARREWLVTNGLGGYAAGTIAGARTRRYHGLLVAALSPPVGRTVLVAKLEAFARFVGDPRRYALTSNEFADGTIDPNGYAYIHRFVLDGTLPTWEYVAGDARVSQRIWMAHGTHTTHVSYTYTNGTTPIELELVPLCTYREYHSHSRGGWNPDIRPDASGCEVTAFAGARPYRLQCDRGRFEHQFTWYWAFHHRAETARGLDDRDDLFAPGRFFVTLEPGATVIATLSADATLPAPRLAAERDRQQRLLAGPRRAPLPEWVEHLKLAADQFIVARATTMSRGHTVIAGYPWFSDWGRDTMIALPGLTLATRRFDIAASILRTFAAHLSRGMLPNRFPDAGELPEYNTVDATLWYFHALDQYVTQSGDVDLANELFPALTDVVDWHVRGTRFGIRMTDDGLIAAGEPGVQLTWMDARVGEKVVTPRIGKPVEINALWYHALVVMRSLARRLKDRRKAERFARMSGLTAASFRKRFWNADRGHLNDVVDATDPSLRPNQIFAVSVTPELLEPEQRRAVVDACSRALWTPVGLRTLALGEAAYTGRYRGGPSERDGAYHQGTVWSWLLGPFALAHYQVHRDARAALHTLEGIAGHLREACIGSVSEVFDGDAPHAPEGCFAQAWGVAEVLRAYLEISEQPGLRSPTRRITNDLEVS